MKSKYVLNLLAAITLTTTFAFAQQTPSTPREPLTNVFSLFADGGGYLGVYAEDINRENMSRYNLNQVRGVGITEVLKDSPAEKAGLRKGDVILRFDGENVSSVRKLNRLVSEIAPDQMVRVTISRGGSEQEVTATIGKRVAENFVQGSLSPEPRIWKWEGPSGDRDGDLVFALGSGRRIGISTMTLTKQLADYFGIADGKGVLVTAVTDDGPAAKAGIKAGDVITSIDGEAIDSTGDISRIINRNKEGDVTLTVIRNKSQQTIRVTPKEGPGRTIVRPEVGRRIVIPRIYLPSMPEMNISIPRIEVPSIPSINVQLPRVIIDPGARVVRMRSRAI